MKLWLLGTITGIVFLTVGCVTPQPIGDETSTRTLSGGHAHNDYEHPAPLVEALDLGFISVEADIHLVGDALLVAHDADEVRPERTLQSLYLDPLRERFRAQRGRLRPDGSPLILLVDFKTEATSTYERLREVLESYRPMLTVFADDYTLPGGISVILSGNRPFDLVASEPVRLVALDGRLKDLNRPDRPKNLVPLISDNWTSHFNWRGEGVLSPRESQKLTNLIRQAHSRGQLIRFWANPDRESYWSLARSAGVDLINTDDLAGLSQFLKSQSAQPPAP